MTDARARVHTLGIMGIMGDMGLTCVFLERPLENHGDNHGHHDSQPSAMFFTIFSKEKCR